MREYAEEGIKHFYFMMLQKDEVSVPPSPLFSPTKHQPILPLPPRVISSSTRQSAVASVGSRTIPAIQTASSQSGQSDNTSEWGSSRTARSGRTRSSLSTITSIATGEFARHVRTLPLGRRGTDNLAGTMRSRVIVERKSASALSEERRRPIWLGWTTSILTVRSSVRLFCVSFAYWLSSQHLGSRTRSTDSGSRGARRRRARSWMRIGWYSLRKIPACVQVLKHAFAAYTQALGPQRGAKGHSGHAANPESQGPCQAAYANKG